MEKKLLELENKNEKVIFLIDQLTVKQLVDLSVDSAEDHYIGLESRNELIKRGKDNIQARIQIKKACKDSISSLDLLLQKMTNENNNTKEVLKLFKNKFLNSISVLDRLELEWQKYDLGIKK